MLSTYINSKLKSRLQNWFSITVLTLFFSCDSFVEVDLPKSQLTRPAVFESSATANAAVTDIYSKMRDQGPLSGTSVGITSLLGNYADELQSFSSPGDASVIFYTNALLASNASVENFWNAAYNQIYSANAIIEGLENSTKLSIADKNSLRGESLFVRALIHFYLVNLYGDVPYITTTDYLANKKTYKNSSDANYKLIINDLEEAITLLPATYKNSERTRPNKFAASSMLARVYLYNKKWAESANAASSVLNAISDYQLETPLNTFTKKSRETIWQFQPSRIGKNTDEASTFTFVTGPPPMFALTMGLVNSFELSDLRKSTWIKRVTNQSQIWYHAYKYKLNTNTSESLEYSIVFRLAEQHLIRAEARANQGDLIGAKEDLNMIRKRAGLTDTPANSQGEILQAILQERQLELFTEFGHRFFDLKRSGTLNNVLSPIKTGWNAEDSLFPIPQNEINTNPNLLPQNNGY